jgi:hypothetical protein
MNELKVTVNQEAGKINCNFAEIEAYAQEVKTRYSGIVVTEDSVAESKKDIATLRKLYKNLDDARKQVKERYMEPYQEFEKQIRESLEKIQEPIAELDEQVKEFERQRKEEKKQKIEQFFEELAGDMKEYLSLEKIYDKKWENKTTSYMAIREDIKQVVDSCRMAVGTIQSMNSEAVEEALKRYKLDMSLPNAISFINAYEARKAQILQKEKERLEAEQKRREEQEAKRREEEQRKAAEQEAERREEEPDRAMEEKDRGEKIQETLPDDAFWAAAQTETEDDLPAFVSGQAERQWRGLNICCTGEEYLEIIANLTLQGFDVREA